MNEIEKYVAEADRQSAGIRARAERHPLGVIAYVLHTIGLVAAVAGVSLMLVGAFSGNTPAFVVGCVTTLAAAVLGHRAATFARYAVEASTGRLTTGGTSAHSPD
jgi:hypothetical protein